MRSLLILFVRVYQMVSYPLSLAVGLLGFRCQCKFAVSCSEFAVNQINQEKKLIVAVNNIFKRLVACGPWSSYLIRN